MVFAASVTVDGGVTMSLLVAVPPRGGCTVMSLPLALDAVMTNVAGVPSETLALVDWMRSTGTASDATSQRNAVEHAVVRDAAVSRPSVCAAGADDQAGRCLRAELVAESPAQRHGHRSAARPEPPPG